MIRVWLAAVAAVLCAAMPVRAQPVLRLVYPCEHPERGLIAYGDVSLTADAVDVVFGVASVEFYLNGELVGADTTYPYSHLWRTVDAPRGLYHLKVVARNDRGDASSIEADVELVPSPDKRRDGGSVVSQGLLPNVRPMLDVNMRDPSVTLGPDGVYYLVGTTGHDASDMNGGVEMWRSRDLRAWEYVGLIWSFERDATWQKPWGELRGKPFRAAWRPQLLHVRGKWRLLFGVPGLGTSLLESINDSPVGPYRSALLEDKPLTDKTDASLFVDDGGEVYLLYEGGWIVPLDEKWRFTGQLRRLGIADGGARLFKHKGRYYLAVTREEPTGRSSLYLAASDALTGPFDDGYEAVPCGGGGDFFRDAEGNWWAALFGDDEQAPWCELPAMIRVGFDDAGRLVLLEVADDLASKNSSTQ